MKLRMGTNSNNTNRTDDSRIVKQQLHDRKAIISSPQAKVINNMSVQSISKKEKYEVRMELEKEIQRLSEEVSVLKNENAKIRAAKAFVEQQAHDQKVKSDETIVQLRATIAQLKSKSSKLPQNPTLPRQRPSPLDAKITPLSRPGNITAHGTPSKSSQALLSSPLGSLSNLDSLFVTGYGSPSLPSDFLSIPGSTPYTLDPSMLGLMPNNLPPYYPAASPFDISSSTVTPSNPYNITVPADLGGLTLHTVNSTIRMQSPGIPPTFEKVRPLIT